MKYDCLIVDDEEVLAETTSEYFNMFDVQSAYVTSSEACLAFLQQHEVSLILLDINLGATSGFELCRKLRQTTQIPILFISARTSNDDILIALNIGGDDYIQKPYTLSVLHAKVKAVLKRYNSTTINASTTTVTPSLDYGPVTIDEQMERVRVQGVEVKLKAMEFKLLTYLASNKNRIIPKEELFRQVWGDSFVGDGTLNVHIRHLREKLEVKPNEPQYIKTVWGKGYILEDGSL
ncbi:response regulator transcription factor [Paenibacillus sp. PR3]|uniref:Response regulator transcription factor n=1 Tax=Paenibacillus terricola TaxID=2763503 RepID=A0ABR8N0K7_9BACL|nr:response regulator transcription factor [Paenibacillus terricola]MBD3921385.1 response regulator transcription factor [Paenibacillus terricola]